MSVRNVLLVCTFALARKSSLAAAQLMGGNMYDLGMLVGVLTGAVIVVAQAAVWIALAIILWRILLT